MLFTNCVTYKKYVTNIYMLFENSVAHNKCDHNIYLLFQKLNSISQIWFNKNMSYKKFVCLIKILHVVEQNYFSFDLEKNHMS